MNEMALFHAVFVLGPFSSVSTWPQAPMHTVGTSHKFAGKLESVCVCVVCVCVLGN
jgi:hypothetical protein